MISGDYFFIIFLSAIVIARIILAFPKRIKPSLGKFRIRHYMYAVILIPIAFLTHSLTIYAFGTGLLADELPLVPVKGLGYRDEQWRGCNDYFTAWCVAGVFTVILVVFIFRSVIAGWLW